MLVKAVIKSFKRILMTTVAMGMSHVVLAHEGHGGGSGFMHDAEHAMWTLSGLAIVALVVGIYKYRSR